MLKRQQDNKMKKIDKDFILSDSSVNCYGFRLLTSGYQLNEFAKNPIGYYMHDREKGVLLKWQDLRIEGDKVLGKPCINLANERGQQTVDEINSGFLNAASFGQFVVIKSSDDPALKLPGQTGVTVTKWFNRECSIVDVPGNFNAISLYDTKGGILDIKELSATTKDILSVTNMTWSQLDKAGLLESLRADNYELFLLKYKEAFGNEWKESKLFKISSNTHNYSLEQHSLLASNGIDIDINGLLASAIKDNDITQEIAQELKKQYENKPYDLPPILQSFANLRLNFLMALDWNELDKSNQLSEELQQKFLTGYKLKRYIQFGKKSNGGVDNEAFLKFAIDNGYIDKEFPTWNFEEGGTNTKEVIFNRIYDMIIDSTNRLMKPLDNLSEDQINRLKQEAFASYKRSYFQTFGIVCNETFKIGKLNY